jgi:CRISPR-associated exonuclease Cas4
MEDDDFIALSALQHYLYCPRQFALIHVERLWAENVRTAEGRLLHERANEPGTERRKGIRTVTAMPLSHPGLGIAGIADVVEFHDSPGEVRIVPVEYKRGRPKAHRADEVQLCAQALCLEAMTGRAVGAGALFYGETRRRADVEFDDTLRRLTLDTVSAVRTILGAGVTPSAEYQAQRCDNCSLIDLCQPRLLGRHATVRTWLEQQLKRD